MAMIEGGQFICYLHNFKTASVKDWNDHGLTKGHTESGTTRCILCNDIVEFTDLPFHPIRQDGSKGISLKCEECDSKTVGSVKRTKTT